MERGDISNDVPPRLLVTLDAISDTTTTDRKFLGIKYGEQQDRIIRRDVLADLWRVTLRMPLRLELVIFTDDPAEADELLDDLDRRGVQPFNYTSTSSGPDALVREVVFRPEVIGVLDTPERRPQYGLAGIDMDYLMRTM